MAARVSHITHAGWGDDREVVFHAVATHGCAPWALVPKTLSHTMYFNVFYIVYCLHIIAYYY